MLQRFIEKVTYPLWDFKDHSRRLAEYSALKLSQWYSAEELQSFQNERLRWILRYCYEHVPAYRSGWSDVVENIRLDNGDAIRYLPVIDKTDIRARPADFLSDKYRRDDLISAATGGSTGSPLRVWFDRLCEEKRNAAAMRSDYWAGWRLGMWIGALWGTPPEPQTAKEKFRNEFHDRIVYLDTMRMDEDSMGTFLTRMRRKRDYALFGHAHSLFLLACFARDNSIGTPEPKAIISTSMMLQEPQRRVIETVFGTPVSNRYGCEEVGLIASECEAHDGMHICAEHVLVEVLDDDDVVVPAGEEGRIVLTDLNNLGMPLIRYDVGDRGIVSDEKCACGRLLPLIRRLLGRTADALIRKDSSRVAGVSLVEKTVTAIDGVEQLQIIQESFDLFSLNAVLSGDNETAKSQLKTAIADVFGKDVITIVNVVSQLDQDRSGKYRFAICKVSDG